MFDALQLFRLDNRVALVTGGSKGLGKAMALALAGAGADVAISSRHLDEAEAAAQEIAEATGRRVIPIRADVTSADDVNAMVDQVVRELGRIDILVNNAGINRRGPILELDVETWHQIIETNLTGPWLCAKAVGPHMIAQRWGRVINVSSILGLVGLEERTPYASSKGGLIQMTRTLALEWAPYGITVNALCPGPIMTAINEVFKQNLEAYEAFRRRIPLGRWGDPEDIQGAVLFMASEASRFMTGAVIVVDGGWTAQ
ncbi:MAG TPA: 3-oxoacyl-ACP reductase FabG [Caldilineae bacterium]|nr:3-oxoacyl-ACP reductase FabG [Caldilineae bacterium]